MDQSRDRKGENTLLVAGRICSLKLLTFNYMGIWESFHLVQIRCKEMAAKGGVAPLDSTPATGN